MVLRGNCSANTQVRLFTRRTDRTQHIFILVAQIITEIIQSKATKGKKGEWSEVQRKPVHSSRESSHRGSYRICLILPESSCNTMCVVYQGSSLEIQYPRVLLGAGYVGTLCLAYTKIPDSHRNRYSSLYKQLRHSELLLAFRESFMSVQGIVYQSSAQMPAKGQPCKQASLSLAMLTLFCTASN